MSDQNRLLVIGFTFPEPKSSAAGSRMMQLLHLFQQRDWIIYFAASAKETEYSADLNKKGIQTLKINPNDSTVEEVLLKINPDVVLFDRFMIEEQFGWRVAEVCPNAVRILDTEDLHFLRKARQESVKKTGNLTQVDLYSETAKREIASILRCDITLLISKVEKELLQNQFKIDSIILWYLPFVYEEQKNYHQLPGYAERKDFMFIGNFLHAPNWDAAQYLKTEIWPKIKQKLPSAKLHIYGAYCTQKVKQLENKKQNFYVKGRAENIKEIFQQYKILLVPLRFGAGLKGKFFDAMQNGTPSITTSIGVEGICGENQFNGKIGHTVADLVSASVDLYTDKKEWENSQRKGFTIINKNFKRISFEEHFFEKLADWRENLSSYRNRNFFGEILMHHRQKSTKYMSRWIEEKNKTH